MPWGAPNQGYNNPNQMRTSSGYNNPMNAGGMGFQPNNQNNQRGAGGNNTQYVVKGSQP